MHDKETDDASRQRSQAPRAHAHEAYTTARAHILDKSRAKKAASAAPRAPAPAVVKPEDYAALAGKSDDTMKKKTGRTWREWLRLLEDEGAKNMTHTAVAALVNEKYQIDGWWAQTVTVGYERLKGIRARGQRLDGTYEANKSRTYSVPVSTLFDAWADERNATVGWINRESRCAPQTHRNHCALAGATAPSLQWVLRRKAAARARLRFSIRNCVTRKARAG